MSRSLILIFNLKVTCRLCSWKFLTTINHIWSIMLSRGEKRSPLKWQYLLLFLGWSLLILSWRSAYVHKVYKILFCCIQNHSSHLFWWQKVCFTLKSVNNILFEKKNVCFDSCGKIFHYLCIKTSFKQMLTHVLFFCYVTKKTPKINPNALGLSL